MQIYHSAEVDTDWQQPQDLQDLLLQSSEEEDVGAFELSDPQLDSEAEIMAYFDKNQTSNTQHSDEVSTKYSTPLFSFFFKPSDNTAEKHSSFIFKLCHFTSKIFYIFSLVFCLHL